MRIVFKKCVRVRGFRSKILDREQWFSKTMDLEFVPPIGMEVIDGEWECEVVGLAYEEGSVLAFDADVEIRESKSGEFEQLVQEFLERGWQISERVTAE